MSATRPPVVRQPLGSRAPGAIVLLGAQRFDTTLGAEVRSLMVQGPVALVTSGWQERELEDGALAEHLGCETVNLRLHARAEEVFHEDEELAVGHREKQVKLRHKQDFYRIRLEHELEANHVIYQRKAPADVLEEEGGASIAAIRSLDDYHLSQCARIHKEYENRYQPFERPSIKRHRAEIADALSRCVAVAIAGGHVASLLNRLRLFGIKELLDGHILFAWSGGAMVVSDRVVLFHDSPPQGPGASEVLDEGLGLIGGAVVLPHPETRLRLNDPERVSVLARRFSPANCLAFPDGAHVTVRGSSVERPTGVMRLCEDGSTESLEESSS